MTITKEIDSYDEIKEMSWCCDELWEKIEKHDLEEEVVQHLEEIFPEPVDETELNDYIRFEMWDSIDLDSYIEDEDEEEN